MYKIKCSNCGYIIKRDLYSWETKVTCPHCKKVTLVNINNKVTQPNIDNSIRPKTNKLIIMLLTYLFSLGVTLGYLNLAIEYRPSPGRHRISLRQNIIVIIIAIHWCFLFDWPFNQAKDVRKLERKRRLEQRRGASFVNLLTSMCIFILFWYLCLGKFVLFDLKLFYTETKKEYLIESSYSLYTILYNTSILCCYTPYLIYYYFDLNFNYLDTKRYFLIFSIINFIFAFLFFISYYS